MPQQPPLPLSSGLSLAKIWQISPIVAAIKSVPSQTHSPIPAFPPVEQRLHTFVQAMKTLAELTGGRLNPYMEQNCKDFAANLIADYNRQSLTATEERWLGVVNFAESELGKKVPLSDAHISRTLGDMGENILPSVRRRRSPPKASPRDTAGQWSSTASLCLRLP